MSKISPKIARRIRSCPYYAFLYARNILKGRLPDKLEEVFATDPHNAYLYAKHRVEGPAAPTACILPSSSVVLKTPRPDSL
jgi:hypothetical protein